MKCQKCQQEIFLPFKCPYCADYFCSEHRLPENHECPLKEHARAPKEETSTAITQKQKPYEYTVSYVPFEPIREKVHFSSKEIKHLVIAILLVMGIGLSLGILPVTFAQIREPNMLAVFTIILTTSFFIHEIAHKIAAQRKGLWAEFRLTFMGVILTVLSIFSPLFKIISPGAVMIAGLSDKENIGKISIAGPTINIALSAIFLAFSFVVPSYVSIFLLVAAFNAWIALFNLIPMGLLDGFKVFLWDKKAWVIAFMTSLGLTLISYGLVYDLFLQSI